MSWLCSRRIILNLQLQYAQNISLSNQNILLYSVVEGHYYKVQGGTNNKLLVLIDLRKN